MLHQEWPGRATQTEHRSASRATSARLHELSSPTGVERSPEREMPAGDAIRSNEQLTPVRVCLVGPSLDIIGGQAVQADRLLRHLRQTEGVVTEFVPHNPRLPGVLRSLQQVKYLRTLVTTVAYVALLIRRVRRCDVVHTFSASFSSYVLAPLPALLIGRLLGKRTVLNYRSGDLERHLQRWPGTAFTMRLADAIVSPSPYLVDVFARFRLRAHTIPNYLDLELFPYEERPFPRPVFLVNRLLEPGYNHDCALRAFALVQEEIPEARLIIAGYGSRERHIKQLIVDLGLRNVTFLGRVSPTRMRELYHEADVYLNTPDIDCFPGSILEAFASGIPVVTTLAGGIRYLVTHGTTGFVAECGDSHELAQLALRILREPGLSVRVARAGRDVVIEEYTWASVGPQWPALYTSLIRVPS